VNKKREEEETMKEAIKKVALAFDTLFENFAICALVTMIFIVVTQVTTRKIFNFVFFWSEEMTLLLLTWFSFMGMAIGFREGLHLNMDLLENILPKSINKVLDKIVQVSIVLFGLYFMVQGWDFTVMMHESTLPATKLPTSIMYLVMPVSGLMTTVYGLLQLCNIDTKRHKDIEEGGED
jgi:TRAP-type C4-dicarboxylate transport system permease small subunit